MLKKFMMMLAAVFAMGTVLGSTSRASAYSGHRQHATYSDCCGPVRPVYLNKYTTKHYTEYRHRDVYRAVHFTRYRPLYHVSHVHVVKNIHTVTHVHVSRIRHIVDVPHYKTVYSTSVYHTGSFYTTVSCGCRRHPFY